MALRQKVYGIQMPFSARIFCVHGIFSSSAHSRKPVAAQSEIGNLRRLQLKLELVCDKGDKFRISWVLDFPFLILYTNFGSNPITSNIRSRTGIDPADAAEPAVLTVEVGST